ncbi:hypothetical protein [Thalassotalea montiporae]
MRIAIRALLATSFYIAVFSSYAVQFTQGAENLVQRQEFITIYLDVLVNKNGDVIEAKLASGQKEQGIFTQFALKKVRELKFSNKSKDGKAAPYWLRNYPYQAGNIRALNVKNMKE